MRKIEGERRPLKMRNPGRRTTSEQGKYNVTLRLNRNRTLQILEQEQKAHQKRKIKFSIALQPNYIKFTVFTALPPSFD
jgi:putative alpha-1,2-mannosidase